MKTLYAVLAVPGFLLPLSQLFRPFDLPAFLTLPFVNPISTMFAFDLIVSCLVFWMFVVAERRHVRRPWLYIALTLLVGLSFALPMFMLARERARVA
jgi:hypothetical protein